MGNFIMLKLSILFSGALLIAYSLGYGYLVFTWIYYIASNCQNVLSRDNTFNELKSFIGSTLWYSILLTFMLLLWFVFFVVFSILWALQGIL